MTQFRIFWRKAWTKIRRHDKYGVTDHIGGKSAARGLLKLEERAEACYCGLLSDAALNWLISGGVITREQRADAGRDPARHQRLAAAGELIEA